MQTVRMYVDPISPFVWLATKQIARIEAAGVQVEMVPVLFAAMLNKHGLVGPAEVPAKRVLTFRDVMRQASAQGLEFAGPPGHPFNPLPMLRMATAISGRAERIAFVTAVMAATWELGQDAQDFAVLARVARDCGLDADALVAAGTPEVKAELARATEQAINDGIFGVPSFVFEGELFWGADRVDSLLHRIAGHRIDEARLQEFLDRAPLATRQNR
ncbi:2-hydroxychromene-2-carboxylate isomerase [Duganella sp. Root198D2]|uniref:2-hydroxychromene-2-carboxylate isomerase n=1 Tax=Duganella sp. Root198D2 TaxID=1736489 RepID=UPI00070A6787|nr:2-hydroxychromene-2-carboxylate isomerase [Duganella sp. Root198D2]